MKNSTKQMLEKVAQLNQEGMQLAVIVIEELVHRVSNLETIIDEVKKNAVT